MEIELKFPLLNGGLQEGLNDGDIETFEGDVNHYIARECAQNTIDAANITNNGNKPAELHFELKNESLNYFPALTDLVTTFMNCKKYWPEDGKIQKFCDNAIDLLKQKKISILKISDYGTTGLTGDDFTRTGRWFGLVRSKGVSTNQRKGAGK